MAEDNVENARTIDHVVSLYWALDAMCMIGLAVGDLTRAEHAIEILLERSAKNALAFWQALGHSYQGQLLIKRGDFATGVQRLRVGLDELRETRYVLRSPGLLGALARGLASMGELSEAQAVIDEALAQCERTDERWTMPELLRVRGDLLVQESNPEAVTAVEHYYQQGLQLAHRQGALLLELRCATSMARLWRRLGRSADALTLLRLVYDRFTEGFDTADLKATRAVLDEMR
jgi:predicted ATPase